MIRTLLFALLFALPLHSIGQDSAQHIHFRASKIEPPNWWVGMKRNQIQLMVSGQNLAGVKFDFENPQLQISKVTVSKNTNYAFLDLEVPNDLPPKTYKLVTSKHGQTMQLDFPIRARKSDAKQHQGFGPEGRHLPHYT